MKIFQFVVSSCLVSATIASVNYSVNVPKLSVTVEDGQYSDAYGLKPKASWSNSMEIDDNTNIECGIEADVRITKDIKSLPKKFWGKFSSTVGGAWGISGKADFKGIDFTNADVNLGISNDDEGLSITANGSCSSKNGLTLNTISAKKTLEEDGANIFVSPTYDVQAAEATVIVSYEKDGTGVEVEASKDAQTVTLSRRLDDENTISPKINSVGDFSVAWEHQYDEDGTVTTTFEPQKSISIDWTEKGWKANVSMDLGDTEISNVNVSLKKELVF